MKILIVDDDPDVVEVVTLIFELQWEDASVVTAPDGIQGVDMAKDEAPEMVILDIGLPDIDGIDVCRRIREFSRVPIVMLTVRDTDESRANANQAGADKYLTKPFKASDLLGAVNEVLENRQTQTEE